MKKKGTLLFDYDGTIHETLSIYYPAFLQGYEWLVKHYGVMPRSFQPQEIAVWLGVNSVDMWNRFLPQLPEEAKREVSQRIGEEMLRELFLHHGRLYEGAREALAELKEADYRLLYFSNCKLSYMQAHREVFDLDQYFDGYYPCEAYDFAPKEEIFQIIKRDWEGPFFMIGDREVDARVGRVHEIPFIACTYGYGCAEEWEGAAAFATSPSQWKSCLSNITPP